MNRVRLINADVLAGLAMLRDESVQCCVTSPPYWSLRQYFFDKASVIRYDLTTEEREYVEAEIKRRGIKLHVQTT